MLIKIKIYVKGTKKKLCCTIKNSLEGCQGRLEQAVERTSNLEDADQVTDQGTERKKVEER
jgi:hypothetical protein